MNAAAALVVAALVVALVAAGAGAGAATDQQAAGASRRALAAKLGDQLHKAEAHVLGALKSARRTLGHPRRAARLTARGVARVGARSCSQCGG